MFKRTLPTIIAALALTGVVTVGVAGVVGPAGAGSAGACPPDETEPSTSHPPTTDAPSDGRCAIDAEAYFRNYSQGAMDMATTAMPTGIPAQTGAEVMVDAAEPPPPIVIDEPGVLDDNTFVDAGDSLWVATDDDRESTFALDVDTGSFDVAQTFLANGYRPEPDSIRPEEWINAFSYGDEPATSTDLAVNVESSSTGDGNGDRSRRRHIPPARRRRSSAGKHHIRHRHVRFDGHPRTARPRPVVARSARAQPASGRHDRDRHLRRRRLARAAADAGRPSGSASSMRSTRCAPVAARTWRPVCCSATSRPARTTTPRR